MGEPNQAMPDKTKAGDDDVDGGEGGRTGGGESGGGPYKDGDQVEPDGDAGGFMGHGGQTDIAYRGGGDRDDGDTNSNAPADDD